MEKIPQSLPQHSSALDVLRTLAIFLVFTSHFRILAGKHWFGSIGHFGNAGVDLFFVMSGFLIASQLFRSLASGKMIDWKEFYIRRGLRIWPNYLLVVAVYFLFPVVIERSVLSPWWRYLTFTQNFGLSFETAGAFSHAWSLCVEEHFYLFFPVILIIFYRRFTVKNSVVIFLSLFLGEMVLRYFLWNAYLNPEPSDSALVYYREIYYPTYSHLDGLVIGVAIAATFRFLPTYWQKISEQANWFFGAGLMGLFISYEWWEHPYSLVASIFAFPSVSLSFGCLVIAAVAKDGFFSRLQVPFAKMGATLAFSFYLTHKWILHLFPPFLIRMGVGETSVFYPILILLACLPVSALLYFAVEKPCLNLRDRLLLSSKA